MHLYVELGDQLCTTMHRWETGAGKTLAEGDYCTWVPTYHGGCLEKYNNNDNKNNNNNYTYYSGIPEK